MSARFPRQNRLVEAGDFKRIFADAKRIVSPNLLLLYRDSEKGVSRLGLAISKKHVKLAVQRNRIKRLAREYFRRHYLETNAVDIVIVSRYNIAMANSDDIKNNLERLWWKLKKQCAVLR